MRVQIVCPAYLIIVLCFLAPVARLLVLHHFQPPPVKCLYYRPFLQQSIPAVQFLTMSVCLRSKPDPCVLFPGSFVHTATCAAPEGQLLLGASSEHHEHHQRPLVGHIRHCSTGGSLRVGPKRLRGSPWTDTGLSEGHYS